MKFVVLGKVRLDEASGRLYRDEGDVEVLVTDKADINAARAEWRSTSGNEVVMGFISLDFDDIRSDNVKSCDREAFNAIETLIKVEDIRDVIEHIFRVVYKAGLRGSHVTQECLAAARRYLESERKERED